MLGSIGGSPLFADGGSDSSRCNFKLRFFGLSLPLRRIRWRFAGMKFPSKKQRKPQVSLWWQPGASRHHAERSGSESHRNRSLFHLGKSKNISFRRLLWFHTTKTGEPSSLVIPWAQHQRASDFAATEMSSELSASTRSTSAATSAAEVSPHIAT